MLTYVTHIVKKYCEIPILKLPDLHVTEGKKEEGGNDLSRKQNEFMNIIDTNLNFTTLENNQNRIKNMFSFL